MDIKIALAGNPNTGKTTLFNALTGANQYVGNWPGVTVEKKEGKLKGHKGVTVTDLPGIYSLSPYTLEELVARKYLLNEHPDAVLNIIDGTNLERNIYLSTQLAELGIPMVIAVNMCDVVKRNGDVFDVEGLKKALGVEVVEISALKGTGIKEVAQKAVDAAESRKENNSTFKFSDDIENAIEKVINLISDKFSDNKRWYAVKLLEKDGKIIESAGIDSSVLSEIAALTSDIENKHDDDIESIITTQRYEYISSIIKSCYKKKVQRKNTLSDRIDLIVTNRILALPIFALIMYAVYYISVSTVGTIVTDWTNDVLFGEIIPPLVEGLLDNLGVTADWLRGLILEGIVGGVGAVLGFVPQLLVLFLFLAFLEGCGYMARVAFIMDRIFRKFGLSGKSFIPMLISTGCGIPGVMASRTIENEKDRRMTIMTTTFMPCGAKLPIIALIAGALFNGQSWVAPSAYFVGIAAIVISGIMLKKSSMFAGDPAPFIIELPAYHLPTVGSVLRSMWERGWSFIKKAGTVILVSAVLIWFTSNYGFVDGKFGLVDDLEQGLLCSFAKTIAWIFAPLGFGNWKSAVAAVMGLVAKENVVSTFGVLYHYAGEADLLEDSSGIWANMQQAFTPASAYAFLVFNLLCAPCFAAIGAIKREMNSAKWTAFAIGYQTIFAYGISLVAYNLLTILSGGFNILGIVVSVIVIAVIIFCLVRPASKPKSESVSSVSLQ